jgi:uncharacterized integral membrane protein
VNERDPREGAPRQEGRGWRFYLIIGAALLLLIFVIQNSQKVPVEFLFSSTETPLFFALLLAGALGALIGWAWPHVHRDRKRLRDRDGD